ncbi:unnamed protein product [Rotaria sordida]|uniref:Uncharacterized protein n=1 Tax=Rotaria sordida TaxID=392033 RepID=A0A815XJ44_9BILA|nr:unnamed protein product [Rotaria sordida]CAF1558393.1 unnamed protein product [Rotaria sordida]
MMSNVSQESQQLVVSKNNSILTTCQNDVQQQQSFTQSSVRSTNSIASASLNTDYNESYLRQKFGIKDLRVNLVDCMKCYVRIPRCTVAADKFEQPVSDSIQRVNTNMAREVHEYREEQEILLQKQHQQTTSEITEEEEEENYHPIDYLDDYNPMNSLIIVDLPWPTAPE